VHASELFVSAITILEVEAGTLRLLRRDPVHGAVLRSWTDGNVLPAFDGRTLPVDTAVGQRRASLHVPDPRAERDARISATALVHRLQVVTRRAADFEPMGGRNDESLNWLEREAWRGALSPPGIGLPARRPVCYT
jgi:predicted nucleic acid-binding protein